MGAAASDRGAPCAHGAASAGQPERREGASTSSTAPALVSATDGKPAAPSVESFLQDDDGAKTSEMSSLVAQALNEAIDAMNGDRLPAIEVSELERQTSPMGTRQRLRFRFRNKVEDMKKNLFGSDDKEKEEAQAWSNIWEQICNNGEIGTEDKDALQACERWRRAQDGERHHLSFKLMAPFRHADWERLTVSIRSGVPSDLRTAVWYACSGAATKMSKADRSYAEIRAEGRLLDDTEAAKVIEVDVPRTGVKGPRLDALKDILLAFAAKNPEIGYCQSMNFVAATFLLYCSEEHAFWMLCSLIEDLLPTGYYTSTMTGLRVDLKVFDSLIKQYLPELHRHLAAMQIDLSPITMNWFLCLFVNTLPAHESHCVMDCLLHEGSKVLFRTALSILRIREQDLLNAPGVMEAYFLLRVPFSQDSDDKNNFEGATAAATEDLLSSVYGKWLKGFSTDVLLKLRKEHRAIVEAEDAALEASRKAYRAKKEAAQKAKDEEAKARLSSLTEDKETESPADKLRRKTVELLRPFELPDVSSSTTLGFAERSTDAPTAAADWLSMVTGHEVHEDEGHAEMPRAD